jgi:hypothetical protein
LASSSRLAALVVRCIHAVVGGLECDQSGHNERGHQPPEIKGFSRLFGPMSCAANLGLTHFAVTAFMRRGTELRQDQSGHYEQANLSIED